jgi:O-antigen/teichoic acid export membrane protein
MTQRTGHRSQGLKRIVKGAASFSTGDLLSRALQFIVTVTVIRILAPEEYGLLTLALTMAGILTLLSTLGLSAGLPRFVAKTHAKESSRDTLIVGLGALIISVVCALCLSGLVFLGAKHIADLITKPDVHWVLAVLVLSVPATVAIRTLTAIFRGIENARAKVWFEDVGSNLSRVVLLVPILLFGLGFSEVVWIYVVGAWTAVVVYGTYFVRYFRVSWPPISMATIWPTARAVTLFSLPLLGMGLMAHGMSWAGSLTIGVMHPADEVGFFNAALRLANLLPIPLSAMLFLYLPVATQASETGSPTDRRDLYTSTTKWSFFITFPIILYMLADAEFVVTTLLGDSYGEVANVLRVLVIGFSIHTLLGPNGMTLVAFGNTRTSFMGSVIGLTLTVIISLMLVPFFGAIGAGSAVATGQSVSNIYISVVLYRHWGIHPFTRQYTFPLLVALVASIPVVVLFPATEWESLWLHVFLLVLFVLLGLISPLITKSLTEIDLEVLGALERRLTGRTQITHWMAGWARTQQPNTLT